MDVAYAFLDSYGGYEIINQSVRSRDFVPLLGLEVLHQLLVLGVEPKANQRQ